MAPDTPPIRADAALPAARFAFRVHAKGIEAPWSALDVEIHEELSGRCEANVDLVCEDPQADAEALFGITATIGISRDDGRAAERRFTGIIRRVQQDPDVDPGGLRRCRVVVEPAFACLSETVSTRKFLDVTVPQIVRQVLEQELVPLGRKQPEMRLTREREKSDSPWRFASRELCVQYGETSRDFVRRILAEEGITYLFDHSGEIEHLVAVDSNAGFASLPGGPIPFIRERGRLPPAETIKTLRREFTRTPGRVVLAAFDATRARATLMGETSAARREATATAAQAPAPRPISDGIIYDPRSGSPYDFDGKACTRDDVAAQATLRCEEANVCAEVWRGTSDVIGLEPGRIISVVVPGSRSWSGSPIPALLVTSVRHRGREPGPRSNGGRDSGSYSNEFTCIPADVPFRPKRIAKPEAVEDHGVIVAVAEESGDADPILTDVHGRVRVWFDYDREVDLPPRARSPWIPVSEMWAGSGFGTQIIPREGMHVRIEYLHDDPDRPIVADCMETDATSLPSRPPAGKTRLTIRSRSLRSSSGANHHNEISLEDAAEREEVFVRAGRDFTRKVLEDEHTEVDHDERRVIGADQKLRVKGARTKGVFAGETVRVCQIRESTIEGDDDRVVVTGNDGLLVKSAQTVTVRGLRTTEVTELERSDVGGELADGRDETVVDEDTLHVTSKMETTADEEWRARQGETAVVLAGGDATAAAGNDIGVNTNGAEVRLTKDGQQSFQVATLKLVCGSAQITFAAGKITIKAPEVIVRGAQGAISLNDQGATVVGTDVVSSAVVLNEVKGPLVVLSGQPGSVEPLAKKAHELDGAPAAAEPLKVAPPAPDTITLNLVLYSRGFKAASGVPYKIMLPTGDLLEGTTDASGGLGQQLPAGTRSLRVAYEPSPGSGTLVQELTLVNDGSPDEEHVRHLRHLGFGDEKTAPDAMILAFQKVWPGLKSSGLLDGPTKDALAQAVQGKRPGGAS